MTMGMTEKEYVVYLEEELASQLANLNVIIKKGEYLLYQTIVIETDATNSSLVYTPATPQKPKRGNFAFQTDLLIKEKDSVPLVVVEVKYASQAKSDQKEYGSRGFTSHDVITYSSKALKHKSVYPYLRYGLVVGNRPRIENKFFIHNVGFDFAIALGKNDNLQPLIDILREQVDSARTLRKVMLNKKGAKFYNSALTIEGYDIDESSWF